MYDIETSIPTFFHITEAKVHDMKTMDEIPYEESSFYIFDRGYNDLKRLHNIKSIGAFFVVRGKTRTSKLAAKELKVLLTKAAITAMVHDPQIKTFYARKVSEGKHKASVINAIRAKIIYQCFAVVRRQTPFVKLMA